MDLLLSVCIPFGRKSLLKERHSLQALATTLPHLQELDLSFSYCGEMPSKGVACLSLLCNLETLCLKFCHKVHDEGTLPRPIGQEDAAARTLLVARASLLGLCLHSDPAKVVVSLSPVLPVGSKDQRQGFDRLS